MKVTGSEVAKELKAQGVRPGFSTVMHKQAMVVKSLRWRKKTVNLLPRSSVYKKKWPVDEGSED